MSDKQREFSYHLLAGQAITSIGDSATKRSSALQAGVRYVMVCDNHCHVRLGESTTNCATTDFRLPSNTPFEFEPTSTENYVCAIAPSGQTCNIWIASRRAGY